MSAALAVVALSREPLDALLWRAAGAVAVEPVLLANPGLAELGPFLPEGRAVLIPAAALAPPTPALLELWD